jgi:hypothetical protein
LQDLILSEPRLRKLYPDISKVRIISIRRVNLRTRTTSTL